MAYYNNPYQTERNIAAFNSERYFSPPFRRIYQASEPFYGSQVPQQTHFQLQQQVQQQQAQQFYQQIQQQKWYQMQQQQQQQLQLPQQKHKKLHQRKPKQKKTKVSKTTAPPTLSPLSKRIIIAVIVVVLLSAIVATTVAVVLTNQSSDNSPKNDTIVMPPEVCLNTSKYYCNDTKECLQEKDMCNGHPNCPNSFDELSCGSDNSPNNDTTVMPPEVCLSTSKYYCNDTKECLQEKDMCNGYPNCPNSFDELSCVCTNGQYKCNDSRCLNNVFLCDGVEDCPNGDDETHSTCVKCKSDQFKCLKNNTCIRSSKRCDGVKDCGDGSDESKCFKLAKSNVNVVVATKGINSSVPMCYENSNINFENHVCQMNGYKDRLNSRNASLSNFPGKNNYIKLESINNDTGIIKSSFTETCQEGLLELNCEEHQCGTRAEGKDYGQYIINGHRASPGAWPWYALLNVDGSTCGSVLIDNKFILTAAHCVVNAGKQATPESIQIQMGMVNPDDPDLVSLRVQKLVVHPNYTASLVRNDLALLRLSSEVTFSDFVRPLCMSDKIEKVENAYKTCVGVGFGTANQNIDPDHLLQTRLNIFDSQACSKLHEIPLSPEENILCVGSTPGNNRNNVCFGDSGGGLSCMNDKGVWFLVGINSYVFSVDGISYNQGDYRNCQTSVIAHVAKFLKWIDETKADLM